MSLPLAPVPESEAPRRRVPWVLVIAGIVAVALVATACVVTLSLNRSLRSTRSQLSAAGAHLTDAQSQLEAQRQEVDRLQQVGDDARSQLDDANAAGADLRTSLDACQELFRLVARFAQATPPPKIQAVVANRLVSCFQGQLPPSLFP